MKNRMTGFDQLREDVLLSLPIPLPISSADGLLFTGTTTSVDAIQEMQGFTLFPSSSSSGVTSLKINGGVAYPLVGDDGSPMPIKSGVPISVRLFGGKFFPQGSNSEATAALQKRVANLTAFADIHNRVSGAQDVLYDIFEGDNDYSAGKLDTTKTTAKQAITAGTTVLTDKINAVTGPGFKVGQEITIFDDAGMERVKVTKGGSEIVQSTVDKTTPVNVVIGAHYAYNTTARPQVLSNGWLINVVKNGATSLQVYKSEDNGTTWTLLTTVTGDFVGYATTSFGTKIYLATSNNSAVGFIKFDATTVGASVSTSTTIFGTITTGSRCAIAVNADGSALTIVGTISNPTHTNSNNVVTVKSTDDGATWTKHDGTAGFDYLTTENTSGYNGVYPYAIYDATGKAVVAYTWHSTSQYAVYAKRYVSSWTSAIVFSIAAARGQNLPVMTLQTAGANAGRLWIVWYGTDDTDTTYGNIRCKYSDDNGATWVSAGVSGDKITSGNTYEQRYPSITTDANGDVYIMWRGIDPAVTGSYANLRRIKRTNGTWGSPATITSNTTASIGDVSACDNLKAFEQPITLYRDEQASAVKLYGKWTNSTMTYPLETTALTLTYKKNAVIARSTVDVDVANHRMKFLDFVEDNAVAYDRTTPIDIAYDALRPETYTHARPMALSNGWIVQALGMPNALVKFFKSEDGGATWSLLTSWTVPGISGYVATASYGTKVFALTGTVGYFTSFDATTAGATVSTTITVQPASTAGNGLALAAKSETELFYSMSLKNSTYPNSYNVVTAKTMDGGATWTKHDGAAGFDYWRTDNTTGVDATEPSAIYDYTGKALIGLVWRSASTYYLYAVRYTTSWSGVQMHTPSGDFMQKGPSMTVQPVNVAGETQGRIYAVWSGDDSVTTGTTYAIKCMYSDNNGASWSNGGASGVYITSSANAYNQFFPCVATDSAGDVHVMWAGVDASSSSRYNIYYIKRTSGTWGTAVKLTTNTTNDATKPAVCDTIKSFENPMTAYCDYPASKAKFYGKFTIGTATPRPVLFADARYNIVGKTGEAYNLISWIDYEKDPGISIDAKLSTQNEGENEVMTAMAGDTPSEVETGIMEQEYLGSGAKKSKMTLRVTMMRNSTSIDKAIKKILGAVS